MVKSFKGKLAALLCMALLMSVLPTGFLAADGNRAAFTYFRVGATTVNSGQAVTFTIRTIGANFLFADAGGGQHVPGTRQETNPATGETSWTLSLTPTASQTVVVYANSANQVAGASIVSVPVTVNASAAAPSQPQLPPVQQSGHSIISIEEIDTNRSGSVSLRIVTDSDSGAVWINHRGRYAQANRVSQSADQSTWEVNYSPNPFSAHQVVVSANHAFMIDGSQVTQNFDVNIVAPYVPAVLAAINSVTVNQRSVDRGERATITVRTNRATEHVWAEVDGSRVNGRVESTSASTRRWTIDIRPDRSQSVRVFANTTNTDEGAVSDTIRVDVGDARARIHDVRIQDSTISRGSATRIEVETNAEANNVWAEVNGARINGRRENQGNSTTARRRWTIDVRPEWTQTISVFANSSNETRDADRSSVQITVNEW
jgi:hypothetical protein